MAQRPKEEMRRAILAAAQAELASVGFEKTTLANVATRAGTSIGNVYKYFSGKEELFAAAVPDGIAVEFAQLLRARASSVGATRDPSALAVEHPYRLISKELMSFAIAHRDRALFLLDRAEGTAHAHYFDERVNDLAKIALDHLALAYPRAKPTAGERRALRRIYRGFLQTLVAALRDEASAAALERAIGHASTYHLAGLRAFFESMDETGREEAI